MEYYVRKNTESQNIGTKDQPFLSISRAAEIAMPGDTILIGEGVYREWVSPVRGGTGDDVRITYKNIPGEHPVISGSEVVSDWTSVGDHLYMTMVPRTVFGEYCPFEIELFGDWHDPCGQVHHTGEVYADGTALYEAESLETIAERKKNCWYSVCNDQSIVIWVYMPTSAPADHIMEISVRPFGFFPKDEKIHYITVSGLTVENVATQWAPPTAFQGGAIGTHWSKGWIIEDCVVRNSKCVGISLGKRKEENDNLWSIDPSKGGSQTYTEVIFTNLKKDWSRENVGSHIIRNNTIYNCGQAGIVGCMGGIFSVIENNHIYNINVRGEFGGAEIAGIKLHAAIDVMINKNIIHDTMIGIWLDWEAQGARVTRNILFNSYIEDFFIEVSHGPAVIDNNILLSKTGWHNNSQGTAFVHNLVTGRTFAHPDKKRFTMYHFAHETAILGSIFIYGGDDRIYNNLYIGNGENTDIGNAVYNGYNNSDYRPDTSKNETPTGNTENTFGTYINHNAYLCGAQPWIHETNLVTDEAFPAYCHVVCEEGRYYLHTNIPEKLFSNTCPIVDTALLGTAFESGAAYENADGTELRVDTDIFGNMRHECNACGPFAQPVPNEIFLCSVDHVQ